MLLKHQTKLDNKSQINKVDVKENLDIFNTQLKQTQSNQKPT